MRFVRRPAAHRLALLVALLALTACGNGDSGAARPAVTALGAVASSAPTTAASATPATAVAPSTAASVAGAVEGYAALPQSKTPEGYYVLGDPNAPATITFFSDFI